MALGAVAAVPSTESVDTHQVSTAMKKWAYTGSYGSGGCFLSRSCIAPWRIWERGETDGRTVRRPSSRQRCAAAAAEILSFLYKLNGGRQNKRAAEFCVVWGSGLGQILDIPNPQASDENGRRGSEKYCRVRSAANLPGGEQASFCEGAGCAFSFLILILKTGADLEKERTLPSLFLIGLLSVGRQHSDEPVRACHHHSSLKILCRAIPILIL